jgi:hypothetical protein
MSAAETDQITLDAYVLDVLMHDLVGHDRAASSFIVYLLLWRHTLAKGRGTVQMSLRDIAAESGLSKRGVQEALSGLARRRLIGIARESITDVPVYSVKRPWRR